MNITEAVAQFFASQTGQYAVWVLLLPLIDFVLGIAAAFRDNTFRLDAIAAWVRKHLAGRIIPIWALLFLGYFTPNVTLPVIGWEALTTVGAFAAAAYVAETIGSILASWGPSTSGVAARDPLQPVPKD